MRLVLLTCQHADSEMYKIYHLILPYYNYTVNGMYLNLVTFASCKTECDAWWLACRHFDYDAAGNPYAASIRQYE